MINNTRFTCFWVAFTSMAVLLIASACFRSSSKNFCSAFIISSAFVVVIIGSITEFLYLFAFTSCRTTAASIAKWIRSTYLRGEYASSTELVFSNGTFSVSAFTPAGVNALGVIWRAFVVASANVSTLPSSRPLLHLSYSNSILYPHPFPQLLH